MKKKKKYIFKKLCLLARGTSGEGVVTPGCYNQKLVCQGLAARADKSPRMTESPSTQMKFYLENV